MVKPSNPPLSHGYAELLRASPFKSHAAAQAEAAEEERRRGQELPLIDLGGLRGGGERERAECAAEIARASSEWGFFQVVNHGVRGEVLERMRGEIVKVFGAPFEKKAVSGVLNNSYGGGTPRPLPLRISIGVRLSTSLSPRSQKKIVMETSNL